MPRRPDPRVAGCFRHLFAVGCVVPKFRCGFHWLISAEINCKRQPPQFGSGMTVNWYPGNAECFAAPPRAASKERWMAKDCFHHQA
jgi:hypothetical protein